jgi:hypothetical protein
MKIVVPIKENNLDNLNLILDDFCWESRRNFDNISRKRKRQGVLYWNTLPFIWAKRILFGQFTCFGPHLWSNRLSIGGRAVGAVGLVYIISGFGQGFSFF